MSERRDPVGGRRPGYDALREKIEADTHGAQDELDRLESKITAPTLPPLAEMLALVGDWRSVLTAGDIPSQRRVLADLVEMIAPVKIGYGRYEARIVWTLLEDALRAVMTEEAAA